MADKRIDQLVAATTLGNNDLLVLEQNNQAKKMSGATLASFVYNAATDKIAEVNQAVADAQDAVDSLEEQKNTIAEAIASMADLGTDTTLSTTGMAADAKATGDRIKDAETAALAGLDQAEITGVAVASFDDGADDAPVKALKVAIKPQQDLHGQENPYPAGGGKNLMPLNFTTGASNGITISLVNNGGIQFSGTASADFIKQEVLDEPLPAGTYTFSLNNSAAVGSGSCRFICLSEDNATLLDLYLTSANVKRTFTTEVPIAKLRFQFGNGSTVNNVVYPQLEVGSTATAFAPYSNICPITGWIGANVHRTGKNLCYKVLNGYTSISTDQAIYYTDNNTRSLAFKCKAGTTYIASGVTANRFIWGVFDSEPTSGTTTTFFKQVGNSIVPFTPTKDGICVLYVSNTPIDTSAAQIELGSTATSYEPYKGETYSITFPSEAGTVYGGTLDVANGVLTVGHGWINLGSMSWTFMDSGGIARFLSHDIKSLIKFPASNAYPANMISSCYEVTSLNTAIHYRTYAIASYDDGDILIRDARFEDSQMLKTALANEILAYELTTPITYTLTPTEVRTLLAPNNIWANTGNILDLIYRRQPISDADIQENIDAIRDAIADREDSGVASKNYAGGSLILIGDTLYETAGPITTGESLVPGSNCIATTVAAQIAYIKSIINGLGNLAYLSYETT